MSFMSYLNHPKKLWNQNIAVKITIFLFLKCFCAREVLELKFLGILLSTVYCIPRILADPVVSSPGSSNLIGFVGERNVCSLNERNWCYNVA